MLEILRLPHLVLTYIGDDDRLFQSTRGLCLTPDIIDDVRCIEVPVIR